MLTISPANSLRTAQRVLCLGAHCDDIEIGCGGTMLTMIARNPDLAVTWVVFSGKEQRRREALQSAGEYLAELKAKYVLCYDFSDGSFPFEGAAIKARFEELKRQLNPDIIFTHQQHDLHQDHRMISELTWNTFRDHLILEYEIPKYDGDTGNPAVFVSLDEATCRRKVGALMRHFETQREKHWFTEDTFMALLRLRGIQICSSSRYAEAFYCRKVLLSL